MNNLVYSSAIKVVTIIAHLPSLEIHGTIIISKFKPVLLSKWNDEEQCYLPFIEPVFTFFEEVNYSKPKLSVFKVELDNLAEALVK